MKRTSIENTEVALGQKDQNNLRGALCGVGMYFLLDYLSDRTDQLPWLTFLPVVIGTSIILALVLQISVPFLSGERFRGHPLLVWGGITLLLFGLLGFSRYMHDVHEKKGGDPRGVASVPR